MAEIMIVSRLSESATYTVLSFVTKKPGGLHFRQTVGRSGSEFAIVAPVVFGVHLLLMDRRHIAGRVVRGTNGRGKIGGLGRHARLRRYVWPDDQATRVPRTDAP